jgi:sporulation protein YlmC with PRC-barrel domain
MKQGSAAEIRKGMRVVGRDGETIGGVTQVLMDEASGIFHGLAVRPNLFTHDLELPADRVQRLQDDVVYADTLESELQPYQSAQERYQETAEEYEEGVGR